MVVRLAVVAGLVGVGFVAGRWLRGPPTDGTAPQASDIPPTAAGPTPELKGDPCDHVPVVEALLERTREEIEGIPRPFPDDPSLQPAAFHRHLEAARRACPEMEVDYVDCDEYPCFAWVRDGCLDGSALPLETWTSDIDHLTLGDGTPAIWTTLWLASPEEGNAGAPSHDSNEDLRLGTRTRRAREAIEATTDARAMTDVEIWTNSVASLEEMLEASDNPEARALLEETLAANRRELERALAAEGTP